MTVILSAAKDLNTHQRRFFAALRMTQMQSRQKNLPRTDLGKF